MNLICILNGKGLKIGQLLDVKDAVHETWYSAKVIFHKKPNEELPKSWHEWIARHISYKGGLFWKEKMSEIAQKQLSLSKELDILNKL